MSLILLYLIFFMMLTLILLSIFNFILLLKLIEMNSGMIKKSRFKVLRIFLDRRNI